MCLAVPMLVKSINGSAALCTVDGVERVVSLLLLDDVRVGDHLVVHAGFAIERLDPEAARQTLEVLQAAMAEEFPRG